MNYDPKPRDQETIAEEVRREIQAIRPERYIGMLHDRHRSDELYKTALRTFMDLFDRDLEVISSLMDGAVLGMNLLTFKKLTDSSTNIAIIAAMREISNKLKVGITNSGQPLFALESLTDISSVALGENHYKHFGLMIESLKDEIRIDPVMAEYVKIGFGFVLGCIAPAEEIVLKAESLKGIRAIETHLSREQ